MRVRSRPKLTSLQELKPVLDHALVTSEGQTPWNDAVRPNGGCARRGFRIADLRSEGNASATNGASAEEVPA